MSKIQNELIKATGFDWDDSASRPRNIQLLCRATNELDDDQYKVLSADARKFIDDVITAMEEKADMPEFPDYEAEQPEPDPEPAPRRRSRRTAPKKDEEPAAEGDAPEAEAAPKKKATRKRATKPKEPKEPKEPKVDELGFKRGERMDKFRLLVLNNMGMSKSEIVELSEKEGCPVTPSTAAMVQYNILNALRVLRASGGYDHWKETDQEFPKKWQS